MRRVVLLVVALAFVQGVGVLSLHAHEAGTPGHSHAFVTHGDDHMGHADDVVEVERGHAELTDGSAPARHLVAPPLLLAVVALTALAGLVLAVPTRVAWPPPPAPPPRLRLAQLSLLRV